MLFSYKWTGSKQVNIAYRTFPLYLRYKDSDRGGDQEEREAQADKKREKHREIWCSSKLFSDMRNLLLVNQFYLPKLSSDVLHGKSPLSALSPTQAIPRGGCGDSSDTDSLTAALVFPVWELVRTMTKSHTKRHTTDENSPGPFSGLSTAHVDLLSSFKNISLKHRRTSYVTKLKKKPLNCCSVPFWDVDINICFTLICLCTVKC